jgi:hypothetical protein
VEALVPSTCSIWFGVRRGERRYNFLMPRMVWERHSAARGRPRRDFPKALRFLIERWALGVERWTFASSFAHLIADALQNLQKDRSQGERSGSGFARPACD